MPARAIRYQYRDPLEEIWLATAYKMGVRVQRDPNTFASSTGDGCLSIAPNEHLDPDDCLAQMIFHELCHSLVEGPLSFENQDWGLGAYDPDDPTREHAALRTQALLSGRHGLRDVMAPTTDFRGFYEALADDPLHPSNEESSLLAKIAIRRAETTPWWPHLGRALKATRAIIEVVSSWAAPTKSPSLYRRLQPTPPAHPSGLIGRSSSANATCEQCIWRDAQGYCQQAGIEISAHLPACERYESFFDCQDCGACCRSAYHAVHVKDHDVAVQKHPELIVIKNHSSELRRNGDHCAALEKDELKFRCTIYTDRPECCREFEHAGENCVIARRRLGLSL